MPAITIEPGQQSGPALPGSPAIITRESGQFSNVTKVYLYCSPQDEPVEFTIPVGAPRSGGQIAVRYPDVGPCAHGHGPNNWSFYVVVKDDGADSSTTSSVYATNGTGGGGWPPMKPLVAVATT